MNSTNRLLLILAGAGAWTFALARADVRVLLDPASDVWRLPALLATWDDLQCNALQLDQRFAALSRLNLARQDVLAGLRGKQIDVREAVHRFSALAAVRARYGISCNAKSTAFASNEVVAQLLNWVKRERRKTKQQGDREALEQAEAELQCCLDSNN